MIRDTRIQAWLLALLCVTLLLGRVAGAHLHLCFDGGEAPSELHLFDLGMHHGKTGIGSPHADTDLAVPVEVLSKTKFDWKFALALVAAAVLAGLVRAVKQVFVEAPRSYFLQTPHFLRPPSRGPPLLLSH